MYFCNECKGTFEEPKETEDFTSEYWGAVVHHTTTVCPFCGSEEIDEMNKCDICGEYIAPGVCICENCQGLIHDIVNETRRKANYTALRFKLNFEELMYHIAEEL